MGFSSKNSNLIYLKYVLGSEDIQNNMQLLKYVMKNIKYT